ncbi:MAG TPA: universal stress protein, partial [Blastocatellia bacterium]|nr:universal stress protein [Blastocatellia bacterium]
MKTLIATDGSEQAGAAINAASRILRRNSEPVDIVCVVPELSLPTFKTREAEMKGLRIRERYLSRIEPETRKILDQAAKSLKRDGLEVRKHMEIGSPAGVIISLSEQYDLTVVGAKGKADQTRFGLGPVSSRVAERSPGALFIGR